MLIKLSSQQATALNALVKGFNDQIDKLQAVYKVQGWKPDALARAHDRLHRFREAAPSLATPGVLDVEVIGMQIRVTVQSRLFILTSVRWADGAEPRPESACTSKEKGWLIPDFVPDERQVNFGWGAEAGEMSEWGTIERPLVLGVHDEMMFLGRPVHVTHEKQALGFEDVITLPITVVETLAPPEAAPTLDIPVVLLPVTDQGNNAGSEGA